MDVNRNTVLKRLQWHLIIILPLSIACILFATIFIGPCDQSIIENLYAREYLLILGGIDLSVVIMFLILSLFYITNKALYVARPLFVLVSDIDMLFNAIWLIMGGFILFIDNRDCIRTGSAHVVFALVAWILSFIHVFTCFIFYKIGVIGYSVSTNSYLVV